MHWTPIVEFCTPCMFDFTIIAHTETLQDDQEFIIKMAHLGHLIQPQWKNAGRGTTSSHVSKYYSQLTRSQILQLYHIYRYAKYLIIVDVEFNNIDLFIDLISNCSIIRFRAIWKLVNQIMIHPNY